MSAVARHQAAAAPGRLNSAEFSCAAPTGLGRRRGDGARDAPLEPDLRVVTFLSHGKIDGGYDYAAVLPRAPRPRLGCLRGVHISSSLSMILAVMAGRGRRSGEADVRGGRRSQASFVLAWR